LASTSIPGRGKIMAWMFVFVFACSIEIILMAQFTLKAPPVKNGGRT
jgi:hypothetical protein